jgi:hypothetical protein
LQPRKNNIRPQASIPVRASVKVVPVESQNGDLFGFMAGEFKIAGNIEAPVVPLKQWKIMKK